MQVFLLTMCEKYESPDPEGVLHTGDVFATLEGAQAFAQQNHNDHYDGDEGWEPSHTAITWAQYHNAAMLGECGDTQWLVRELELGA